MQAITGNQYLVETETSTQKKVEIITPKIDMTLDDSFRQVRSFSVKEMPSNTLAEKEKMGKQYRNTRTQQIGTLIAKSDEFYCLQGAVNFFVVPRNGELGEWLRIKDVGEVES